MENSFANQFCPQENIHQVRSYFDTIDNAVSVGDTNKKYVPSKNPSSPGGTQSENTYLTFNISPVGENICDFFLIVMLLQFGLVLLMHLIQLLHIRFLLTVDKSILKIMHIMNHLLLHVELQKQ